MAMTRLWLAAIRVPVTACSGSNRKGDDDEDGTTVPATANVLHGPGAGLEHATIFKQAFSLPLPGAAVSPGGPSS